MWHRSLGREQIWLVAEVQMQKNIIMEIMKIVILPALMMLMMMACRSQKTVVSVSGDSVVSVLHNVRTGAAWKTDENMMLEEWYFYPDTVVPVVCIDDSSSTGTDAHRRVVARKRLTISRQGLAVATVRDSVVNKFTEKRSEMSQSDKNSAEAVGVKWLRLVLVALAMAATACVILKKC